MKKETKFSLRSILSPKQPYTKQSEYCQMVFNNHPDAVILYARESQEIIEANDMASEMFELPEHISLKGLHISQVMMRYLTSESPSQEFLLNNLSEKWSGEAEFKTHQQNKFFAFVRLSLLPTSQGEHLGVMNIRYFNEEKKTIIELANAKRNMARAVKTKAQFLSSMSHELRTPLNGIIGSSELIMSEKDVSNDIKRHAETIRYSSEHMLGIINDILSFSKLNANKVAIKNEQFHLKRCLTNIHESFTGQFKKKGIAFNADISEELEDVWVNTDELKLSQVLHNLISNALKFTDYGSVLFSVFVKQAEYSEITLHFEISDTGIGVAKDQHEEIFNAFSQVYADDLKRRYGGTGLGLAISRQLVQMLGGCLEIESELHKGSLFYFDVKFPFEKNQEDKNTVSDAAMGLREKDIRGVRVLVVEDNEINAKILKSFLTKWQLQIKAAITGVHAIELVKYHKFDLILMDLEMPEMNGYTALKVIREMNIDTPVIAFTATLLENAESLITEAGFTDYVVKPFRPAELRSKIEMYCERKVDYI